MGQNYTQLGLTERIEIYRLRCDGWSFRRIGAAPPASGEPGQSRQERERDTIGHVNGPPVINRSIRGTIGEDYYLAKIAGPIPLFFSLIFLDIGY